MRLRPDHVEALKRLTAEQFGAGASVHLFGSRLDDNRRGGDVDVLVEVPANVTQPALEGARLAARMSRALHGRKIDVVLTAPNLAVLPIHRVAREQGLKL